MVRHGGLGIHAVAISPVTHRNLHCVALDVRYPICAAGQSFAVAVWAALNWCFLLRVRVHDACGPSGLGSPGPVGGLAVAEGWRPSLGRLGRRALGGGGQRPGLWGVCAHGEAFAVVEDLQWLAV